MNSPQKNPSIIRVFVSSPGDVPDEREVLDEVVASINATDGRPKGFRLELFRWEHDVVPQIGPGPQPVVDAQTPAYDIYLGIMSTRFGTPTEGYGSGTEKEYEEALNAWEKIGKPWITFYFNDAPKQFKDSTEVHEYWKVFVFREKLQKKGITATYTGVRGNKDGFYEKVSEHLRKLVALRLENPAKSRKPTFPSAYRNWLQQQYADIELSRLGFKHRQAIKVERVYVPLMVTVTQEDSPPEGLTPSESREKPQLLLERLDKHSLFVVGHPGTGKSTFCRWVAWLVATGSLPTIEVASEEGHIESFPETLEHYLPLLVQLGEVWRYLPKGFGRNSLSKKELESVLAKWLDSSNPGELDWADVTPHLEHGSALLIFDGVDEVPVRVGEGDEKKYYPRAMLLTGLADAAVAWQKLGNRLLVTSRPYGIDEKSPKLPLQQAPVAQLDKSLRELLVRRCIRILKDAPDIAEQTASEMMRHLDERPELNQLTNNPMLLTAMCIIYDEGSGLPQDKHELYSRIVDNVLDNRYHDDASELALAREHLSVLAYGMHTGAGLGQERATPQVEIAYDEVERMLRTYHDESDDKATGYKNALDTRVELLERNGLLLPSGNKASFYHFTFQDFLAARRLAEVERGRLFDIFCERAETTEWRNTLSFLFSSELATSAEQAELLLNRLIERLTTDSIGLAVVAADCVETLLCRDNRLRSDVEEKLKNICLAAIDSEVEINARNALGLALGHLGDPRVDDDLWARSAYVEVSAGEYAYQDGKQAIDKPFLLSKYPVTNSQFRIFKKDGGYDNRAHWSKEGWEWKAKDNIAEPDYWRDARYNGLNQPVVGVSFYEAEAFCKWAGGFLPDEQQWEAAARGPKGDEYPWGNKWEDGVCNSLEARLMATSPVGLFRRSRSREFGLEDMAGNVWEWCNSYWRDGTESRVLRGGAFYADKLDARSAYRDSCQPDGRSNLAFGLRVARTLSPQRS